MAAIHPLDAINWELLKDAHKEALQVMKSAALGEVNKHERIEAAATVLDHVAKMTDILHDVHRCELERRTAQVRS